MHDSADLLRRFGELQARLEKLERETSRSHLRSRFRKRDRCESTRSWRRDATRLLAIGLTLLLALAPSVTDAAAPLNSWYFVAPMPLPANGIAATSGLDGKIYVMGGQQGGKPLNTLQVYDPVSNTWLTKNAPMPTARFYLAAATGLDGTIYAIGGDSSQNTRTALGTMEAYNPATNTWSTRAPMPTPRDAIAAATAPDGRIFVFGGSAQDTSVLAIVEAYDPKTNSWACSPGAGGVSGCTSNTLADMIEGSVQLAAVTGPNGKIYAFGGLNLSGAVAPATVYDPVTNAWSYIAPEPQDCIGCGAALGPYGMIYLVGGELSDTVDKYDPQTDTWSTVASMATQRFPAVAAAGPDGTIYAMGGGDIKGPFSSVEAYLGLAGGEFSGNPGVVGLVEGATRPSQLTPVGVFGIASNGGKMNGVGVEGVSDLDSALLGKSIAGYGADLAGGLAPLHLAPSGSVGPPTDGTHMVGEISVDKNGTFYGYGGSAPSWHPFSGVMTIANVRVMNTRPGKQIGPYLGPIANNRTLTLPLAGQTFTRADGSIVTIPATATGVMGNLTAADATGSCFLALVPSGAGHLGVSSVNFPTEGPGIGVSNAFVAGLGTGGAIDIYSGNCSSYNVNIIMDITGFII